MMEGDQMKIVHELIYHALNLASASSFLKMRGNQLSDTVMNSQSEMTISMCLN